LFENGLAKEKDLKNHLDATPDKNQKKQNETNTKDKRDGSETPEPDSPESNDDHLELERLQSDNQVMHALDILLSYEIFKHIHP